MTFAGVNPQGYRKECLREECCREGPDPRADEYKKSPYLEGQSPHTEGQSPQVEAQNPQVEAQNPQVAAQRPRVEAQCNDRLPSGSDPQLGVPTSADPEAHRIASPSRSRLALSAEPDAPPTQGLDPVAPAVAAGLGYLTLEPSQLADLAGAKNLESGVLRVVERWIQSGQLDSAAIWILAAKGWARPRRLVRTSVEKNGDGTPPRGLTRERLETENNPRRPDRQPVAVADRAWAAFSLGIGEIESARLIVRPRDSSRVFEPLPMETHLALSLFVAAILTDVEAWLELTHDCSQSLVETLRRSEPNAPGGTEVRQLFPEIVGGSESLLQTLRLVAKTAPRDVSILIQGESGTGKELIGHAIHRLSRRSEGPYVSESCAAFTDSLLESELFGHERGAFTGASGRYSGLIERSDGGTLFLDEVGEMSPTLQSKLLRVLQEREVRRVGGSETHPVDFRLISATHRDLEDEASRGLFRSDLLYRLCVIKIALPPLRQRVDDIPTLARHFVTEISKRQGIEPPVIRASALRALCDYDWPGNVRELRNEVERAVTLSHGKISARDLSRRLHRKTPTSVLTGRVREQHGSNLYGLERLVLGGVIEEVLEETRGNKAEAARILGIPKTNLYRRLRKYALADSLDPVIE